MPRASTELSPIKTRRILAHHPASVDDKYCLVDSAVPGVYRAVPSVNLSENNLVSPLPVVPPFPIGLSDVAEPTALTSTAAHGLSVIDGADVVDEEAEGYPIGDAPVHASVLPWSPSIAQGVMSAYPTVELLFNVLSCVAGSKLFAWSDVWNLDPVRRVRCYRFILADLRKWPERIASCGRPLASPVRVSSAFSGTGMAERCGDMLGRALGHKLTSACLWIEKADGPAALLSRLFPGARGVRDILELLPSTTASLLTGDTPSFDD